jgi:hypothetical protein
MERGEEQTQQEEYKYQQQQDEYERQMYLLEMEHNQQIEQDMMNEPGIELPE